VAQEILIAGTNLELRNYLFSKYDGHVKWAEQCCSTRYHIFVEILTDGQSVSSAVRKNTRTLNEIQYSSSQALQSVVDFGFQYNFPPFLTALSHCMPISCCPSRNPKHPSGWNFNCIVFSTNLLFTGLGCQPSAQPPT
jgi:hypothetical protein